MGASASSAHQTNHHDGDRLIRMNPDDNSTSEYRDTLREVLTRLAAADPRRRRFGASTHNYLLAPALSESRVAELEHEYNITLPADYRAHLTGLGDGGAGPYYGLLPFDHPAQHQLLASECPLPATAPPVSTPWKLSPWRGVVALSHLGCGYLALLVVRGPARGTVWIDARTAGLGVLPLASSFSAFYLAWLLHETARELQVAVVPSELCALPAALSGYLSQCEVEAGLEAGTLAGAELHEALAAIPQAGLAIAATGDDPVFAVGTKLAPCVGCAVLLESLESAGLRADALAPAGKPFAR